MVQVQKFSGICLLIGLTAGGEGLRAEKVDSGPSPLIHVEVLLTTSDTLSESARSVLLRETESIWRRHGVVIHWLPPTDSSPAGQYRLRALIVEKRAIPSSGGALAIGEFVGSGRTPPYRVRLDRRRPAPPVLHARQSRL